MKRIAVIDSSCLIYLEYLQLATKLALYFDVVYVPRRVQEEVNKKYKFRRRLNKLYKSGIFRQCRCADEVRVAFLVQEIDPGEAEGLTQAQEKQAKFFIADDKRAREICESLGLTPLGTVRLLARLHIEGHAEETRQLVHKLTRDRGFRVSKHTVEDAIEAARQPIS